MMFQLWLVNYPYKALSMYRIMGEAGIKHIISAMQGYGIITYIQYNRICVQEAISQYYGIGNWQDKTLLYKNHIINY